jgi:hypothetical protein
MSSGGARSGAVFVFRLRGEPRSGLPMLEGDEIHDGNGASRLRRISGFSTTV